MEKMMFTITETEQSVLTKRASEIAATIKDNDICKGLFDYAVANGCSEEEAHNLIHQVVIPTVDEYNASCRVVFETDANKWIAQKMADAIKDQGLDEQDAAKYKLGVLLAIRKLNAGAVDGEEDVLTEDEKAMLETAEFTPEMIEQIDADLFDVLYDSAVPLYMTQTFETFLASKADSEHIRIFASELWEDRKLKCCVATAMCVAHHNGELPSVPEKTEDVHLVLGTCQGVDVVNIEAKVSAGEMTIDTAYKILKVIGAVVLGLGALAVLVCGTALASACVMVAAFTLFGEGILACVVTSVLTIGLILGVFRDETYDFLEKAVELVGKGTDFVYNTMKRSAKGLYHYTLEHVVPVVESGLMKMKDLAINLVATVRRFFRNMTRAHGHA